MFQTKVIVHVKAAQKTEHVPLHIADVKQCEKDKVAGPQGYSETMKKRGSSSPTSSLHRFHTSVLPAFSGMQRNAEYFSRSPQSHARPPRARSPADDDRHAFHFIPSAEQGINALHQIPEGPYLPSVCVTREHQINGLTCDLFCMPRCMGEEDRCSRGPACQRLRDKIAVLSGSMISCKIVHACTISLL
jgi:hypothetical protein